MKRQIVTSKREQRTEIITLMEEFLKRGGKIQTGQTHKKRRG
jgi:hypothetical protein